MKNPEFVYLIECSSGSWDSYVHRVGGIFLNEEEAIVACDKLNAKIEKILDSCPIKKD